jgi:hypothetical protein
MITAVREGESRALVVRGGAGVGKTALLEYVVESASGLRLVRALGVETEMELAFAALHQLCAPMIDHLGRIPVPQRDALEIVFGLSAGPPPDRFLVGLAALSLLRNGDARALLGSVVGFVLDERVRDRIVAETRGNPLALLELPRGLTATQLATGFGLLGAQELSGRIEESFLRRLDALPEEARWLLLVAAAEPVGDPVVVWRACERLGSVVSAAEAAEAEGLLSIGDLVTFRHPLVRSAVYRSASLEERQAAHLALAEATDPELDPDRRAWHRAAAAAGPDEEVASELERAAGRARARGGLSAAAAFLQRAATLTGEPSLRGRRALAAAETAYEAGALDGSLAQLATAEAGDLDERGRARAHLLRAQIAFASRRVGDAPALMLGAARELEAVEDLSSPAELGREVLPHPHLLQRGRQGRPLRGLGRAGAVHNRDPRGVSRAALVGRVSSRSHPRRTRRVPRCPSEVTRP